MRIFPSVVIYVGAVKDGGIFLTTRGNALAFDVSARALKNLKNSLNVTIAGPEGSR